MRRAVPGLVLALALLTLGLELAAALVSPGVRIEADEGTFLAMLGSLVEDGDLRFGEEDAGRLAAAGEGRGHVILQRSGSGVAYSKPILFPVLAAPFHALLGERGVTVFNVLVLALAAGLAGRLLAGTQGAGAARWGLLGALGAAPVLAYALWRMTEALQFALALAGLAAALAGLRSTEGRGDADPRGRLAFCGGLLLGALTSLRLANGAVAAIPVLAAVLGRRWRRAVVIAAGIALSLGAIVALTAVGTGSSNPYRAERTSFTPETGYPVGADAAAAESRFTDHLAKHWTGLRPRSDPSRMAYTSLYLFVGRHTGLLVYFPALLVLGAAALRRPDATTAACAAGVLVTAVFFVGWMPGNWFGGETFLGNRYFLPAWAAVLFAPRRLPRPGAWAVAWLLAVVVAGSGLLSILRVRPWPDAAQRHAHAGVFRLLPYESTAQGIAGRRDRYWTGHFLRFVDPFAEVGRFEFRLGADAPAPAEVLQAQWRPPGTLELEVAGAAPGSTLVAAHRGREERFDLPADGSPGRVLLAPGDPWRHHPFWWDPRTTYHVRMLRFRLEGPPGTTAEVRWLGDPAAREEAFARSLLELSAPDGAETGRPVSVVLRVRNDSGRIWEQEDVTPVRLRTWWEGQSRVDSEVWPLPRRLEPGADLEMRVEPVAPQTPGRATLHLDLVLERVAWFEDRVGEPLARVEVEVRPEADGRDRAE